MTRVVRRDHEREIAAGPRNAAVLSNCKKSNRLAGSNGIRNTVDETMRDNSTQERKTNGRIAGDLSDHTPGHGHEITHATKP